MSTHISECEVCDHLQTVQTYGDWTCEHCGQRYRYDEGHGIVLTEAQIDLLRKHAAEAGRSNVKT